jgi:IclR family pca regulon transcriptional regulator
MMIIKNSTDSNDSSYTVPALSRGLMIIEMFRNTKRVLSTQDFSEALQVSPSSIYRIVQTLIDMKYLSKVARNTYELGPQVISNGFSYLASRDLVDVAAPHLQQLRDSTSVSCHLAILDGWETIYIYRRALLSQKTPKELSQLYIGKQLDNHPPPHPQNLLELVELIQIEQNQGYAISRSDNATAIAAPLFNYAGEIVAAINASGPDVVMKDKVVNHGIMEQLLKTAAKISMELGYRA